MARCHHNPELSVRSEIGRMDGDDAACSKRRYSKPQVEKNNIPSVVTGGPSGKVEKQPHQGHKRP